MKTTFTGYWVPAGILFGGVIGFLVNPIVLNWGAISITKSVGTGELMNAALSVIISVLIFWIGSKVIAGRSKVADFLSERAKKLTVDLDRLRLVVDHRQESHEKVENEILSLLDGIGRDWLMLCKLLEKAKMYDLHRIQLDHYRENFIRLRRLLTGGDAINSIPEKKFIAAIDIITDEHKQLSLAVVDIVIS